jgi:hypothetical protein
MQRNEAKSRSRKELQKCIIHRNNNKQQQFGILHSAEKMVVFGRNDNDDRFCV